MAGRGKGVIFISSDFAELVRVCHRVIVLREGRQTGELAGPAISEEAMTRLAYAEHAASTNQETVARRPNCSGRGGIECSPHDPYGVRARPP